MDDRFTEALRALIKTSEENLEAARRRGKDLIIQTLDAMKQREDFLLLAVERADEDYISRIRQIAEEARGETIGSIPIPPLPNGHMPYGRGADPREAMRAVDKHGVN